jgi:hypothetical protein
MSHPCVIARPLDGAQRMLREAGVTMVDVKQTMPPRGGPNGALRVIRQRAGSDGVEIVVAASAPLPETEACHD